MGQHNQFEPGWEVPNDGTYVEIGEHPDSANPKNPKSVHLQKGDTFPMTSHPKRKWTREKGHHIG